MSATKQEKLAALAAEISPELVKPLNEVLADNIIPADKFKRMFELISNTFYDIEDGSADTKKMEKRISKLVLEFFDLGYEDEVSDETLRMAVKLIRENIVRQSEKEALAKLLAAEFVSGWKSMDSDRLDAIIGDDGLAPRIEEMIEDGIDFSDPELASLITELTGILSARYAERLDAADLDALLRRCSDVAAKIDAGKPFFDDMLELVKTGAQKLGFIPMMRRAFAGLLLGDLILRQVGKGLGIKGDVTVTDFILFVGVKVFETDGVKKVNRDQLSIIRNAIDKVL